jgi:ribonuclease VapC
MQTAECYVMDACALLRLAQDEAGAEVVDRIMVDAKNTNCRLLMHILSLGEVVHSIARQYNWETAVRKRAEIRLLPITILPFREELFWQAVKFRSAYSMSYNDCVAVALAFQEQAVLVSGDPEFEALGDRLRRIQI